MNVNEIRLKIAAIEAQQRRTGHLESNRLEDEKQALKNRLNNTLAKEWRERAYGGINTLIAQCAEGALQRRLQAEQEATTRAESAVMEAAKAAYTRANGSEQGFTEAWPRIRQQMAIQSAHEAAQQAQQQQDGEPEERRAAVEFIERKYRGRA